MTTNNSTFTTVSSGRVSSAEDRILDPVRLSPLPRISDVTNPRWAYEEASPVVERRVYQDGLHPAYSTPRSTRHYYEEFLNDPGRWPDLDTQVNVAQSRRAGAPPLGEPAPWYESALRQTSNDVADARKDVKDMRKAHTELSQRVSELERALDQKDVVIEALEASVQEQGQLLNKLVRLLSKMKGESHVAGN